MSQSKEPSQFKQEWEANKLLKRAKKKARNQLKSQGHTSREASKMINKAMKNIVSDNRPERKTAGRGM